MSAVRRFVHTALGHVVWRLPWGPKRMLSAFSRAERGSYYDMLAAAELTERGELRRKYLEHALQEGTHEGIFLGLVRALGAVDRTEAVVADAAFLRDHGIVGSESLFATLGERDFLAFVHVAEADAVEQFHCYLDAGVLSAEAEAALHRILKDEVFHVTYSRQALELYRQRGEGAAVDKAMRKVRWNRLKEAWLRGSRHLGSVVGQLWLTVLYVLAVAPFAVFARLERGGWSAPRIDARPRAVTARSAG